jgi:predicted AlkP superfamily phosphohydrolase/phosphomutase
MIKREPFWLQLSRAGKRIAILDVPVTYPIEGLNGIYLVAWGVHGPCWHQDSWPPELIKEVISRFGSYPHSCPEIVSRYAEVNQMGEFYGELISGVKKKGSVSTYFLDQEAWDLFITVFAESHCAGHNLWYLMDENHPAYDSEIARTLSN